MKKLLFSAFLLLVGSMAFAQQKAPTGIPVVVDAFPDLYPEVMRDGNTLKIVIYNEGADKNVKSGPSKTMLKFNGTTQKLETPAIKNHESAELTYELPPSFQNQEVKVSVRADVDNKVKETRENNNGLEKTLGIITSPEVTKKKGG